MHKGMLNEPDAFRKLDKNTFDRIRKSPEAAFIHDRKPPERPPAFKDKEAKLVYDRELKASNTEMRDIGEEEEEHCALSEMEQS